MDGFTVFSAKSGDPTACRKTVRIHSAYDPAKEAAHFIKNRLNDFRDHCTVIIIGAALGYLDTELARQRPDIHIIAYHLSEELFHQRIPVSGSITLWHPGSKHTPEDFLFENIPEIRLPGLKILHWPPAMKSSPKIAEQVSAAVATVVRRYSGNIGTTAVFGRMWLRNTIRNYLKFEKFTVPSRHLGTTVLAAAGPTLEHHITALKKYRKRIHLWALPSSLAALNRAGLVPDIIFSTDPGHWARLHGRFFPNHIPLAAPLSSALLPNSTHSILLLAQNTPGENTLLFPEPWPHISIPQVGSVAITALEVWQRMSSGPLVLAGLDLCWFDLQSHVRPHTFDSWFAQQTSRVRPGLTTQWETAHHAVPHRNGPFRSGGALDTYADWFRTTQWDTAKIYRLLPSWTSSYPHSLPGVHDLPVRIFDDLPPANRIEYRTQAAPLNRKNREERLGQLIQEWENTAHRADIESTQFRELSYTIDPGGVLDISRLRGMEQDVSKNHHRERVQKKLKDLKRFYEYRRHI